MECSCRDFLDLAVASQSSANAPVSLPKRVSVTIVPDIVSAAFVRFLNPKDRCQLASPASVLYQAPSNTEGSSKVVGDKNVPRMNLPNVIVFGSGYERHEATLSANSQLARSLAGENGIQVPIHVHEPRILVEAKIPSQLRDSLT